MTMHMFIVSAGSPELHVNRGRLRGLRSVSVSGRERHRQSGMTLVIGLVLLVMLMVISVIGFRNTTLSERMTGNALDRNTSFQSAESSGKEALTLIEGGTLVAGTLGYYAVPLTKGANTGYWTQGAGSTLASPATDCLTEASFNWTSCSAAVGTKYTNNASNAQYAIELLSQVSNGTNTTYKYRVTSRSTGGTGDAEVVLQTIYTRVTTP